MRDIIENIVLDTCFFADSGDAKRTADAIIADLPDITELSRWKRNLRDSFDAMCAMRNDINDVVLLPSLESDLLQGPETSVFCSEVAFAVIKKIKDQQARIAQLESALPDMIAPLVWEDSGKGNYYSAEYTLFNFSNGYYVECKGHYGLGASLSLDEGKAAANAHHVAQIMAAFATPPEATP